MPVGAPKPTRIQGTFVRDEEISRVLDFIKKSATVQYDEAMIEAMEKHAIQDGKKGSSSADSDEEGGSDPMLKQAVEVVIDAGQASTSLLQRRCKLGYARAAASWTRWNSCTSSARTKARSRGRCSSPASSGSR